MTETAEGFPKLWTVAEAAQMTRMSQSWFRQAVHKRMIRIIKIGRRVLIPDATIQNLLIAGKVDAKK
jgi:excisionase family DNA binding protein